MSNVDKNRKRILKNGDSYIGLLGRVNDYANDVVDLKKNDDDKENYREKG